MSHVRALIVVLACVAAASPAAAQPSEFIGQIDMVGEFGTDPGCVAKWQHQWRDVKLTLGQTTGLMSGSLTRIWGPYLRGPASCATVPDYTVGPEPNRTIAILTVTRDAGGIRFNYDGGSANFTVITGTVALRPGGAWRASGTQTFSSPAGFATGQFTLMPLATCREVLVNSVKPNGGTTMDATFSPNLAFTVDAAAKLCEFDHFNWYQTVISDTVAGIPIPGGTGVDPDLGGNVGQRNQCLQYLRPVLTTCLVLQRISDWLS